MPTLKLQFRWVLRKSTFIRALSGRNGSSERKPGSAFPALEREVRKAVKERALDKIKLLVLMAKRNNNMDNLDVICIGALLLIFHCNRSVKISLMWILSS